MMTAEVTNLLNEASAARIEARTLANISRRAVTLFESGYKARSMAPELFLVTLPQGDLYRVRVSDDAASLGPCCSCPCFGSHQTCKHLQAVVAAIEEGAEGDALTEFLTDLDDDRYSKY